jgi:predicted  nucleic acid-binding Zn-ribbon protein
VLEELQALLELQADDARIAGLEARHSSLEARVRELDHQRRAATEALERARGAVAAEEQRWRALSAKFEEHKHLQERNLSVLDTVKKAREASAAMAQIEITRKALAQDESDLQSIAARLNELRELAQLHEMELGDIERAQEAARAAIADEQRAAEDELRQARAKRTSAASLVSRSLLAKYERIRSRDGAGALFPLRGSACGRCNTAVPLQRRNAIASGRVIEVCEGCGVLLYAPV